MPAEIEIYPDVGHGFVQGGKPDRRHGDQGDGEADLVPGRDLPAAAEGQARCGKAEEAGVVRRAICGADRQSAGKVDLRNP